MKTLLCISTIEWNELWQRHQEFMTQLSNRGWTVYFVENMGFRPPVWSDIPRVINRIRNIFRRSGHRVENSNPIPSGIHVISPIVLPPGGHLFRVLNKHIFLPHMLRRIFHRRSQEVDVAFVYLPAWSSLDLVNSLKPRKVVYDCVANFAANPSKPKDYEIIERTLLGIANVVLTDSDYLTHKMSTRHAHVEQLHHGVNTSRFGALAIDCKSSDFHTICYFGTIDNRIDWDVIHALQNAGALVTMIGKVKGGVPDDIDVCGPFSPEDLPAVISKFDVLTIPYTPSDFSNGIIPAKLFECLATGKPLLVSPLPYVEEFNDLLYVCSTPGDFVTSFLDLPNTETEGKVLRRIARAEANASCSAGDRLEKVLLETMGI